MKRHFCARCDKAVTRWHYRRCKHYAIVLADLVGDEVLKAGTQLHRAARVAYDLSRQDKLMSYGQKDTMFYALQWWERAVFSREQDTAVSR